MSNSFRLTILKFSGKNRSASRFRAAEEEARNIWLGYRSSPGRSNQVRLWLADLFGPKGDSEVAAKAEAKSTARPTANARLISRHHDFRPKEYGQQLASGREKRRLRANLSQVCPLPDPGSGPGSDKPVTSCILYVWLHKSLDTSV